MFPQGEMGGMGSFPLGGFERAREPLLGAASLGMGDVSAAAPRRTLASHASYHPAATVTHTHVA